MKPSQILIFSALIAAALSWHAPSQSPGGGPAQNFNPPAATSPTPPSIPNPIPTVVASPNPSPVPHPNAMGFSSSQLVSFLLVVVFAAGTALFLSIFLWPGGADISSPGFIKGQTASRVLKNLIREVEESSGYSRNDARAKAKAWLLGNVTSLGKSEILLAKTHFSYLLPAGWGLDPSAGTSHFRS